MNQKHILIFGGTGMLAEVTSYLASEHLVTVIGRDPKRMDKVVRRNPETCHSLLVDYRNDQDLSIGLQELIKRYGPFKQVIALVHRNSGMAMQIILNHSLHAGVLHIFREPGELRTGETVFIHKRTTNVPKSPTWRNP